MKRMQVDEIGQVVFKKSRKAKRVNIVLKPFHPVEVSMPFYMSFDKALKLLLNKKNWIAKNLPKIQSLEKSQTEFSPESDFRSYFRQLKMYESLYHPDKFSYQLTEEEIRFFYPTGTDFTNQYTQLCIREAIEASLRDEARFYLPDRVAYWAEKCGFTFKDVRVKKVKTRWGSCSYQNNLNLNIHLMRLPQHLIDYVIVHELCHTKEKNHGIGFWQLLESCLPGAKMLDKEINQYRIDIY